jgi:hypothetical protein
MSSHISFWRNQIGSAFLAMNSSTGMPSINSGRGTRFCFPLIKIVMNFFFRSRRARFSAAVRLRFGFACLRFFFDFDIVFTLAAITRCTSKVGGP